MELRGAGDLLGQEQSGNLAAVGFDLFVHMLEEAIAELRGETIVHEVEPDLTLDVEHYIPDDYVTDVGLRLSFYKRFAARTRRRRRARARGRARGSLRQPPEPVLQLVRVMALKPALRSLRVVGCDASAQRVTLHFSHDAPLDPAGLTALVARTPRLPAHARGQVDLPFRSSRRDAIERVAGVLCRRFCRCEKQRKKDAMTSPAEALAALFAAERALRQHERTLLEAEPKPPARCSRDAVARPSG